MFHPKVHLLKIMILLIKLRTFSSIPSSLRVVEFYWMLLWHSVEMIT